MGLTVVSDNLITHGVVPQPTFDEIFEEPWRDDLEFACENAARINVTIGRQK